MATQPKINPIPVADWNDEMLDALGAFPGGLKFVLSQVENKTGDTRGQNMLGLLATYPKLAKAFLTFNNHVAVNSSVPTREREILILRAGWLKKSEYELIQHVILGKRAGLTDDEVRAILSDPSAPPLTCEDADLVNVADELAANAKISDETFARISKRYSNDQIMDMIFVVGCYEILANAINSFNVPLDEGVEGLSPDDHARMMAQ